MKWLKRTCWLAAWGVWVWLGLGLFRELPRELGSIQHHLTLDRARSVVLGFVAHSSNLAVIRGSHLIGESTIFVYNGETGEREIEPRQCPPLLKDQRLQFSRRFGVFFSDELYSSTAQSSDGLHLLDLARGAWRRIGFSSTILPSTHPDKPWIAFVEHRFKAEPASQLVVYDFVAGRRLFVRPDPRMNELTRRPFFIPNQATLVVPSGFDRGVAKYEIWDLEGEPRLEKVVSGPVFGDKVIASANRRVAFQTADGVTQVFGLDEGKLLFTEPHRIGTVASRQARLIGISADGKQVIGTDSGAVWNVDTSKLVWRPTDGQFAYPADDGRHFHVLENWESALKEWKINSKYTTRALRRFDTAEVVWRSAGQEVVHFGLWNADRTLGVTTDGRVYRLPLRVNWPLLALCQTILALPLVLLWSVLRWRRSRKNRASRIALPAE